ncbi:MAG: TolC family protein [Bacteroidaceae bacterium]|nr:TolC family protein [Bacteroidaceae bacterium]
MKRILLLTSLLASLAVCAQPSVERCKEMAREHYPLIRRYGLIEQSRDYTLSNAARAWLPQVTLSGQATLQSDVVSWPEEFESMLAMQGLDMPGIRRDQYKVQIDVQQTLWDGGKSRTDRAIAEGEAAQERMSTEVELYAVDSRVEDIYFGILLMQEQQRQIGEMMQRLQTNLDQVNALVENGMAMQADADAVEVQLLTQRQSLGQVEARLQSFRRILGLFIGEELGEVPLPMPVAEEPVGYDSERPELRLMDAQMALLQAREQMVDVSLAPRVALFAQGYYGYPGLNMFENMVSHRWTLNGIVGVRMNWNISSLYTSKTSRRQLQNARDNVMLQREVFAFNSRLQAEQESAEVRRIREAIADDDRIVALRSRVREAAEVRLQEGMIDTHDLLGKISDETTAKIARSTHQIELVKAIYDLKHTLNK